MTEINLSAGRTALFRGELPAALAGIGVAVPDQITTAIAQAEWSDVSDQSPEIDDARRRLVEATTEADWQAAQRDLVAAAEFGYIYAECRAEIERVRNSRFPAALRDCSEHLIAEVCEKYNRCVPEFTDAVDKIRDIDFNGAMFSMFDLTAEDAASLQTAKAHAEDMSKVLRVYGTVIGLDARHTGTGGQATAARIGDYQDLNQLYDATDRIRVYSTRGHGEGEVLRPLSPHVAVLLAGGSLNLKHPDAAEEHAADLAEAATPSILPRYYGVNA